MFEKTENEAAFDITQSVESLELQVRDVRSGASEQFVMRLATQITGLMWSQLLNGVPGAPELCVRLNEKDASESTTGRLDETVHFNAGGDSERLVAAGGYKSKTMLLAEEDVKRKVGDFNVKEWGTVIRFLPTFMTTHNKMQFCLYDLRSKNLTRVAFFDLNEAAERAAALKMSINMLRLVLTMIPFTVPTAFLKKSSLAFSSNHVVKTLGQYRAPAKLVTCGQTYHPYHDVYLVGQMVEQWADAHNTSLSDAAEQFVLEAQKKDGSATVATMLKHRWLE